MGKFHNLPLELRESLIAVAQKNVSRTRKFYDNALEQQRVARQQKEEIMMESKLDQAQEEFIAAIIFTNNFAPLVVWRWRTEQSESTNKFKV